jgi:hypothetical protein
VSTSGASGSGSSYNDPSQGGGEAHSVFDITFLANADATYNLSLSLLDSGANASLYDASNSSYLISDAMNSSDFPLFTGALVSGHQYELMAFTPPSPGADYSFSFSVVPEPTTLALLGVGPSVLLLGRARGDNSTCNDPRSS